MFERPGILPLHSGSFCEFTQPPWDHFLPVRGGGVLLPASPQGPLASQGQGRGDEVGRLSKLPFVEKLFNSLPPKCPVEWGLLK